MDEHQKMSQRRNFETRPPALLFFTNYGALKSINRIPQPCKNRGNLFEQDWVIPSDIRQN